MTAGSSIRSPAIARMRSRRRSARSRSGAWSRAATTARQAWTVAIMRGRRRVSIGMPYFSRIVSSAVTCRSGVKPRLTYSSGDSDSTIMRSRHSIWSP
jgi:hypothetical protein